MRNTKPKTQQNFDYVVIGAGSSGCVLANRLSAVDDNSVLVIEAGGLDNYRWLKMPMGQRASIQRGGANWNYKSEPERHLNGRTLDIPRGKVLGGTSSINGMVYARGNRGDYDDWYRMGLQGWSWNDVLPYFRRSESNWRGETTCHGGSGPMKVTRVNTDYILFDELAASVRAAGHIATADVCGDNPGGLIVDDVTVFGGKRVSASSAFLHPIMSRRPNLKVVMNAHTTRILIEEEKAVGVEFLREGRLQQVRAFREVIVAAGVYNSPQILLLSGIGPAGELKRVGIAPLVDLPGVGNNLQEHLFTPVINMAAEPVTFVDHLRCDRAVFNVLRWAMFGTGPFSTPISSRLFLRTRPGLDRPDAVLIFFPVHMEAELWFPLIGRQPPHRFTCGVCLLHEQSRGRVSLRSRDPLDPPRIDFNFYDNPADMDTMLRGIRACRDIYAREPMASMITEEEAPGANVQSDVKLAEYVREMGRIAHHGVGTCAMGTGPDAVLDAQLRVRGVGNLRVADASVMPMIVGGNTNAPVIMIGEKASDMILGRGPPTVSG